VQSVIRLAVAFYDISVQLRRSAGISPGRVERPRTAMSQNVVNVTTNQPHRQRGLCGEPRGF